MSVTYPIIADVLPKTQAIAAASQYIYSTTWTADTASDVVVYNRDPLLDANDALQIVSTNDYTVAFIGAQNIVQVTFLFGLNPAEGNIVTITRATPTDRLNLYTNTNFTSSMLNADFGTMVLIDQQNELYNQEITPRYNTSATVRGQDLVSGLGYDLMLPVLSANQIWAKNNDNTQIIAYDVPSSGSLAPGDATYILSTPNLFLPNATAMSTKASGFMYSLTSTGAVSTRVFLGTANQINLVNGDGIAGNPTVSITDNPIIGGQLGLVPPKGTTAQRPGSPIIGQFRYNTTLNAIEFWNGTVWSPAAGGIVDTITGTINEIDVNSTDSANPILSLSSTLNLPGTFNIQASHAVDGIINDNTLATASSTNLATALAIKTYITSVVPIVNPSALTKTDDTNVTLTLGGTPSTALLQATSLTLGWTGQLSEVRGGTHQSSYILGDTLYSSAANTLSKLAGNITAVKQYLSQTGTGAVSAAPVWATISGSDVTGAALTKTDDTNVTLTLGGSPTNALLNAASLTLGWTGLLSIARGGNGVSSVTTSPTASAWAGWDANLNLSANSFLPGFATTATAGASTTLTVTSKEIQEFTGTLNQTVVLPVVSTLATGKPYKIINNSSGSLTVNSSGGNLIQTMAANTTLFLTSILNTGTTAASWNASYVFDNGAGVLSITGTANQVIASASTGAVTLSLPQDIGTGSSPTFAALTLTNPYIVGAGGLHSMQIFTSGSAATYTRPANVKSILVKVVGGGGGGGGTAGAAASAQGAGGGGAGGFAQLYIASAASTYTYTVGGGGNGGAAGNNNGTTGTTTTFGASLQATGGVGGTGSPAVSNVATSFSGGGAEGVGSSGDINASGGAGIFGGTVTGNVIAGIGGTGMFGGGAGGTNAKGYGGGGGGASSTTTSVAGGNGTAGIIIVYEFS